MPPFCEEHQIFYVTDYINREHYCAQCRTERTSSFNPLPKAIETTEILNEVKADKGLEGILTEEELNKYMRYSKQDIGLSKILSDKVINSHLESNTRNRLLVLENDELLAENTKLNNRINGMQEIIDRQDILISQVVDEL